MPGVSGGGNGTGVEAPPVVANDEPAPGPTVATRTDTCSAPAWLTTLRSPS